MIKLCKQMRIGVVYNGARIPRERFGNNFTWEIDIEGNILFFIRIHGYSNNSIRLALLSMGYKIQLNPPKIMYA